MYIWRIGIALHSLPRMLNSFLYYQLYNQRNPAVIKGFLFTWFNRLNSVLHIVENAALLIMTYISSTENFGKLVCWSLFIFIYFFHFHFPSRVIEHQTRPLPLFHIYSFCYSFFSILLQIYFDIN